MALTKDGRVFIGPKSALGLSDFQRLYTTEGATPQAAASYIHTNYPTEAKSVMESAWRNLGINDSPERYFSNPSNIMPLGDGTPEAILGSRPRAAASAPSFLSSPSAQPGAWMNPNLPIGARLSFLQQEQQTSQAEAILKGAEDSQLRKIANDAYPLFKTPKDDATAIAAQLAGDSTGLAKKLLIRNTWPQANLEDYYASGQGDEGLKPYTSEGYGPLANTSRPTRLDMNLYMDDDFQETLTKNPEAAKHVYMRLTGRSLDGDLKETLDARDNQKKIGREFAAQQLKAGAKFDPITGKWKVWQQAEAPEGGVAGLMGGAQQPYRQLVDANDEQNQWLNENYEYHMGRPLQRQELSKEDHRVMDFHLQRLQKHPRGQQLLADAQKKFGTLSPQELVKLSNQVFIEDGIRSQEPNWFERAGMFIRDKLDALPNAAADYFTSGSTYLTPELEAAIERVKKHPSYIKAKQAYDASEAKRIEEAAEAMSFLAPEYQGTVN